MKPDCFVKQFLNFKINFRRDALLWIADHLDLPQEPLVRQHPAVRKRNSSEMSGLLTRPAREVQHRDQGRSQDSGQVSFADRAPRVQLQGSTLRKLLRGFHPESVSIALQLSNLVAAAESDDATALQSSRHSMLHSIERRPAAPGGV